MFSNTRPDKSSRGLDSPTQRQALTDLVFGWKFSVDDPNSTRSSAVFVCNKKKKKKKKKKKGVLLRTHTCVCLQARYSINLPHSLTPPGCSGKQDLYLNKNSSLYEQLEGKFGCLLSSGPGASGSNQRKLVVITSLIQMPAIH